MGQHMSRPVRIGVQLWPGGAPDYQSWRSAVLHAEEIGTDMILGYDHFHKPTFTEFVDAMPVLDEVQPDVNNFEGWTALATFTTEIHPTGEGYDFSVLAEMLAWRNAQQ
jgi:hypothetical protein